MTTEHPGETATANFANSMKEALSALPASITQPPVPNPPKPPNDPTPSNHPEPVPPVQPDAGKPDKVPETNPPAAKTEEPQIDKWPRTAQEWKKWNEVRENEYKKRDDKITELTKKATEYEEKLKTVGTPAQHPEYESVKKERDQFSEVLKTIAVENHPKFKAYYDQKVSNQVELAKRVAGPEKSDQIGRILSLPEGEFRDRQIEELVADMPPIKQAQIGSVLNALSDIQSERTAEITKARANFDQLQKENQDKAAQARVQLENKFTEQVKKLQTSNPLYKLKEGDDAWNKGVNDRVEKAKHFLLGNPTPEQIIEAATNAASYHALIQNQIEVLKENETLKAQIKSLSVATPTITPRPAENGVIQPMVIPANSRPMDAAAGWIKSIQGELQRQS